MNKGAIERAMGFQALKGFFMTLWYVDPALTSVEQAHIVPYSYLWQLLNPFAGLNNSAYLAYLFIIDCCFALLYSHLSNWKIYLAWQATGLHWFSGYYQNITITWFAPLLIFARGWYFIPLLAFSPVIQKLPWGWPLQEEPAHIYCAEYCGRRFTFSAVETYSLEIAWTILPLLIRWNIWRKSRKF